MCKKGRYVITTEMLRKIQHLYLLGVSVKQLAESLGLSEQPVMRALSTRVEEAATPEILFAVEHMRSYRAQLRGGVKAFNSARVKALVADEEVQWRVVNAFIRGVRIRDACKELKLHYAVIYTVLQSWCRGRTFNQLWELAGKRGYEGVADA